MSDCVLVALSGGVDSAVAAYLLKNSGYSIIGATMQLMPCRESDGIRRDSCCSFRGIESARRICNHIGIQHTVVDLTEEFERNVISYFVEEYSLGRTPNPCIRCNRLVKFASLHKRALKMGCTRIASGHYARVSCSESGRYVLRRGVDLAKDQSYFLSSLNQEQLTRILFPVGELTKTEVRKKAAEAGILKFTTPESQEICFVNGTYQPFVRRRAGGSLGNGLIRDTAGNILGTHEGIELYTIGQRRGLRVAGGKPLYVVGIIPSENTIVLGEREDAMSSRLTASEPNWVAWSVPPAGFNATVRIRYNHPGAKARVKVVDGKVEVEFEEPQFAVTPGQYAVFYEDDTVLGAAVIDFSN